MVNPYLKILEEEFPKLLNLYNRDEFSDSYGYGDRLHWGWKVSDFSNATLQGGVHALALGLKLSQKFQQREEDILKIIKSAILACERIRSKNGSLAEAYPSENSFCVTALVAFDILSCLDQLGDKVENEFIQETLTIVKPMIGFITNYDEEHAIISNHLATGVAAIALWNKLSGSRNLRYKELLTIIYEHQSEEGWYMEYEGADPGYQTLCTYYLSSAYLTLKDDKLLNSISKSFTFLKDLVHPNGTIGGIHGSRNTEVYYPGGFEAMADFEPISKRIAGRMMEGIVNGENLAPRNIDIGNYIPLINSYAFAALHYSESSFNYQDNPFEVDYKKAGLFIKRTSQYYAVLNYKKGGVLRVYDPASKVLDYSDTGYFGTLKNGKKFTSQTFNASGEFITNEMTQDFYVVKESSPTPFTTLILRILSLTLFKSVAFGNFFKKKIVKMLMTGKKKIDGKMSRKIEFMEERIVIIDSIIEPNNCSSIELTNNSRSIHMASSGYFLEQEFTRTKTSKFVSFTRK